MRRNALVSLVAVSLLLGLSACGSSGSTTPALTLEDVTTGSLLAQVRGHHRVALELYRAGDVQRALVHAGHPVAELSATLDEEVGEHDRAAAAALKAALEEAKNAVAGKRPADAVAAAFEAASAATDRAARAVAGGAASTARYRGSVLAALLGVAAHEYEEAVLDGTVREVLEYQDAYGFAREAKQMYASIEDGVRTAHAEDADEITSAFAKIEEALPSAKPPAAVRVSHEDVESAAGLIAHELEETVGALVAESAEPKEIFDRIEALLTQVVDAYGRGEKDEAAELVAKAYLENYELVEADVIRLAKDVNAELEPLLGSQLRARIKAGGSEREIGALVQRTRELLAKARAAVEGAE